MKIKKTKLKIHFWTVGKPHENHVKEGTDMFTKRISHYFMVEWKIIPMPKNAGLLSEAELKTKEGESILNLLKKEDYVLLLDERGKQFSSEGLAAFIQQRANESIKNLIIETPLLINGFLII